MSEVALYGNADLNHRFLGKGIFIDYIPINGQRGLDLLRTVTLYAVRGAPAGTIAFVELREVVEARDHESLDSLNGIIEGTGLPLSLANLPEGQNRGHVYYRKAT